MLALSRKRLHCVQPRAMRVASKETDVQIITLEWPSAEPPGAAASLHRRRSRGRDAHIWCVRRHEGRTGRGSRRSVLHAPFGRRDHAVWQGARLRRGRRAHVQRRAVRRPDRRRESVAAGEGSHSLGRRVPSVDLRRQLPPAPARLGRASRHSSFSGPTAGRARTCSR